MQLFQWTITPQNAPTPSGPGFRDLYLDPGTGDLVLTNGPNGTDFEVVNGLPALAQSVGIALQLIEGEWFNDTSAGVPWIGGNNPILGPKGVSEAYIRQQLTDAILGVAGVASVPTLTVTTVPGDRQLQVSFVAQTDLGQITGSGTT